ncbi:RSP_2648 family PIN domain-containing protein [Frigidibacter oleivorans]|uniref:RSP_2648 family PIN domain-containing protein n=1 Tax=Frigidibacter oleivorans TaxID=2487129 RepID=UPI000F8C59BD|nr:PIN domain-containing protein [Frigidibacter oleivorans]
MRALLDACVLYPTVLRELLFGVARAGLVTPLWSDRIAEEWARAAARLGPGQEVLARGEIVAADLAFPQARVPLPPGAEEPLDLPDRNDRHVLAAAIAGRADCLVTLNLRDFPRRAMAPAAIDAIHPDEFLLLLRADDRQTVDAVAEAVRAEAERLSGQPQPMRALMKRAKLPRFGKALTA